MPLNHDEAVLSLLDGPPLETFSPSELQEEVTELLGDDDPLAVALVIEEAQARSAEQIKTAAIMDADLEPCRLEQPCAGNEPLSGTGRCMTCGAQRRAIERELVHEDGTAFGMGDYEPEPPVRSDTEPLQASSEAAEKRPATPITPTSAEPLTGRVKAALGIPDKDMAHLLGVARPTAQAYATGRLPELIDGVRAEYMLRAVKKRLATLEALRVELKEIVDIDGPI